MKTRAVICDIYGTVLELGPAPPDADARWLELWHDIIGGAPRISRAEFGAGCELAVGREHATARAAGIPWPEVYWPDVLVTVIPELSRCSAAERAEFELRQAAGWHTVRLMPGAAAVLQQLRDRGVQLGIASNAQPYTLRELADALGGAHSSSALFTPELTFWSFAHGFAKPDPHVFRHLGARLRLLGVEPGQTLMVGDRVDHDIAPAREQGWQAWHLTSVRGESAGPWSALAEFVA